MNEKQEKHKQLIELIKEMDTYVDYLRNNIHNQLAEKFHKDPEILIAFLPIKKEEIINMPIEKCKEFLNKYSSTDTDSSDEEKSDEDIYNEMNIIKDMSTMIYSAEKEVSVIKKQSTEVLDEYVNYLSSDKVKAARENKLNNLKAVVEEETDEIAKKKIKNMIEAMESANSYDFLLKRFDKFGKDEIDNILEGYFNPKKGSYIIKKFQSKIKQFGYNPNVMKYFFNIEETFLPEEYHPFNNLFLFIYVRMVSYSDAYNKEEKLFVQSLTGALADLFYHKFDSEESEKAFTDMICKVLDKFMDKVEYFKENNTTYAEHPVRKEQIMEHESKVRAALYKKFELLKYDWKDVNPDDIDIQKLQDMYVDYTFKLVDEQTPSEDEEDVELEMTDDLTPVASKAVEDIKTYVEKTK